MATKKTTPTTIEGRLEVAKAALANGKATDYAKAYADLDRAVNTFNTEVRNGCYAKFAKAPHPFVAFAGAVFYDGKRIKVTRNNESKEVEGITVEKASRRLNLKEFVEFCKFDKKILDEISELQTLLTIREREICTLKHEDYLTHDRFFCRTVADKMAGKTPDSNTQICKKIQGILDMAGVECRIVNPDMHFIQQCSFVHDPKGIARVKPVTAGKFMTIVVDMMAHFVQGIEYSILIKEQKKSA